MNIKSHARVKASPKVTPPSYVDPLRLGAINLIEGCLGNVFGKTVLVVAEDPRLGWYDAAAPAIVEAIPVEMVATVKTLTVGEPKHHAMTAVPESIDAADEVIFSARIGDQGRFKSQ